MLAVLTLLAWVAVVTAQVRSCAWPQYTGDRFLFPPTRCNNGNYTGINSYPLGTKLMVRWTSLTTYVNLYLYQEWGGAEALQPVLMNTSLKYHEFNGLPPQRLALSNTFYFVIYKVNTSAAFLASDYFNISDGASKPVSSTAPISVPTSIVTMPSRSLGSIVPSGTPTPLITPNASNGNASTTGTNNESSGSSGPNDRSTSSRDIGIGLGIGLPCFAAIIGLSLYFLVYRPKRKAVEDLARFQQQPQFYDGISSRQSCVAFSDKQVSPLPREYGNSYWSLNSSYGAPPLQQSQVFQQKPVPLSELLVEMEQPDHHGMGAANPQSELTYGRVG